MWKNAALVTLYLVASTSLLIVNKLSLTYFNFPYTLICVQLCSFCLVLVMVDLLVERPIFQLFGDLSLLRSFFWPGVIWSLPLAFSSKALMYLNPDSIIIFRLSTVFGVALCDRALNGKILTSSQKLSIVMICLGAFLFSKHTLSYDARGYTFGLLYWATFIVSQLLTKYIFDTYPKLNVWSKAFYINLFGIIPVLTFAVISEGLPVYKILHLPGLEMLTLVLSLLLGGLLSYAGSSAREVMSATSFDVLGCAGKCFTIVISSIIFSIEYNGGMLLGLILSISGSFVYSLHSPNILKRLMKKKGVGISLVLLLLYFSGITGSPHFPPSIEVKSNKDVARVDAFEIEVDSWLNKQHSLRKFIIIEPQGGFGNVFHAVGSCLVLAMLTNRALVIDWNGCKYNQFGPPFAELCLEERLTRDEVFRTYYNKFKSSTKSEQLRKTVCLKGRCYASKEYKSYAESMRFGHFPDLSRVDFNHRWPFDIITVKADNYFIGFLFMNDFYRQKLEKYVSTGQFLYPKILHKIFKPVPRIQQVIDDFAEDKMENGKCLAIFARTTGIKGRVPEYTHLFRSKADAARLLGPQHLDCAKRFFADELSHNITIFVASLYSEVKDYFKEHYGNVVYYSYDSGVEFGVSNRDLSIIDIGLLARCEFAIYSYGSTFGHVARALGNKSQKMYQTLTPTLEDGITPIINGIEKTLYQVEGDCRELKSREACSASWARFKNSKSHGIDDFYKLSKVNVSFPESFDHGSFC